MDDVRKGRVGAVVQVLGTPDVNAGATSVDRHYDVGQKYLFMPFASDDDRFQDNNCTHVAQSGSALRARSMKVRSAGFMVSARAASNARLASSLRETLLSSSARTAWNR